jgi:Transposase DDE domain
VDGEGIPIGGVTGPANRHDSPLLVPTLNHASESVGSLPEGVRVDLDRGYDSGATRERLEERRLLAKIAQKGKPAPLGATKRWVAERTSSWHNAHKIGLAAIGVRFLWLWGVLSDYIQPKTPTDKKDLVGSTGERNGPGQCNSRGAVA